MLKTKALEFLGKKDFVSVATCDLDATPNAAPKFLLKIEDSYIYLVDYVIGKTCQNIKENPKVSLSFLDTETLTGYQVNGSVDILDKGNEYKKILDELLEKKIDLSAKRIIEGISTGKTHQTFELSISERIVVLKVKAQEVVEICPCGELKREKLGRGD